MFTLTLARKLGQTLRQLLTGRPGPLLYSEWVLWQAYASLQGQWAHDSESGELLAWKW